MFEHSVGVVGVGIDEAEDQTRHQRHEHGQPEHRVEQSPETAARRHQDDELAVLFQSAEGEQHAEEEGGRQGDAQVMGRQQQQHLPDVAQRVVRIGHQPEQINDALEQQHGQADPGHHQAGEQDLPQEVAVDDAQHVGAVPLARAATVGGRRSPQVDALPIFRSTGMREIAPVGSLSQA